MRVWHKYTLHFLVIKIWLCSRALYSIWTTGWRHLHSTPTVHFFTLQCRCPPHRNPDTHFQEMKQKKKEKKKANQFSQRRKAISWTLLSQDPPWLSHARSSLTGRIADYTDELSPLDEVGVNQCSRLTAPTGSARQAEIELKKASLQKPAMHLHCAYIVCCLWKKNSPILSSFNILNEE